MQNPIIHKVHDILCGMVDELENHFNSDILCMNGPITPELVSFVKDEVDSLNKRNSNHDKLVVVLTTDGGDINTTERIAMILRHNYHEVEFVIPDHAYSAGTILCMSGDKIWMNYTSVLGPIDPQVRNKEGTFVPALGYLEKIDKLLDKAENNTISQAEFLILKDFDLAEISLYEQARDLTEDLLKEWLVKYKFKNWCIHKTSNTPVTEDEKKERAGEIAKDLANYSRWKTHGRPLDMKTLQSLKLVIDDFGTNKEIERLITEFHCTLEDYMSLIGTQGLIFSGRGE